MANKNLHMGIKVRLYDGEGLAYGKGINQLLLLCHRHRSLRKAADEMDMSYRKALQIVKRAENSFKEPLLTRTIGGKDGGGSQLTDYAKNLVKNYSRIEAEVEVFAAQKFVQAGIVNKL